LRSMSKRAVDNIRLYFCTVFMQWQAFFAMLSMSMQ